MVFNDTTNEQGICQEVDFICGTDTDSFPLADKARKANRWVYRVISWARKASVGWKFDDWNHSTTATARQTLVDGQSGYELDSTITSIDSVAVKDSNGTLHFLTPKEKKDLTTPFDDYKSTNGMPTEYFLEGNIIFLKPAPDTTNSVTATKGLVMEVGRETDAFTASDTTQEPPLNNDYQEIIPLGISADYFTIHGEIDKANSLLTKIHEIKEDLESGYSRRNSQVKRRIVPSHRTSDYI